jgi:hypothetical protein
MIASGGAAAPLINRDLIGFVECGITTALHGGEIA